jgi:hypothetical protein
MKKIIKFISFSIILIVLISIFFVYWRFSNGITQITPYPYQVTKSTFENEKEASKADVLIIGDRMGKALDPYLDTIRVSTSKGLAEALNIYNWSMTGEGLHRTLAKIKNLKKLPPVIIYHGASEEFLEKKFFIRDRRKIMMNFDLYHNDQLLSSIITYPPLSRFIYSPVDYIKLNELTKNTSVYPPDKKQIQMELAYLVYKHELAELAEYIKSEESQLVLITSPVNLEIAPKNVCSNSLTTSIENEQLSIKKLIKLNKTKEAFSRAKELNSATPGNALSTYLLGSSALKIGRVKEARQLLNMATALDCETWRANGIFNAIIKKEAKNQDLHIIDFHKGINLSLGRNVLFLDEIYPQTFFYQKLVKEITKKIKIILKLR